MSLATLAELKAYLSIPTGTTTEDVLLQDFLDEATAILEEFVGHPLAAGAATTRRFDAVADVDGQGLTFDCGYCAGITAIVNGDGESVVSADYVTEPRNRGPYFGVTLKAGADVTWTFTDSPEGAIQVTGYWCYSTNADGTADDLSRGACQQLAAWLYRSKDQIADIGSAIQSADGVTVLPMALPPVVLDRLRGRQRKV